MQFLSGENSLGRKSTRWREWSKLIKLRLYRETIRPKILAKRNHFFSNHLFSPCLHTISIARMGERGCSHLLAGRNPSGPSKDSFQVFCLRFSESISSAPHNNVTRQENNITIASQQPIKKPEVSTQAYRSFGRIKLAQPTRTWAVTLSTQRTLRIMTLCSV